MPFGDLHAKPSSHVDGVHVLQAVVASVSTLYPAPNVYTCHCDPDGENTSVGITDVLRGAEVA